MGLDDFNPLSVDGGGSKNYSKGDKGRGNGLDDFLNSESVDSADGPAAPAKKKGKAKPKVSKSTVTDRDKDEDEEEILMKPRTLKRAFGKPLKKPAKKSIDGKDKS